MLLYNLLNTPLYIYDIIVYLSDRGYTELVPKEIFPQEKDMETLFLIDYEDGTYKIVNGEKACIQFLSDQSLIVHLRDKAVNFVEYFGNKMYKDSLIH